MRNYSGKGNGEKKRMAAAAVLLAAALALQAAARNLPGFGQWYSTTVYPVLVQISCFLWGELPFSLSEIGLYLFVLGILLWGIRNIRRPMTLIRRTFFALSLLFFLYTANCGVNYYRSPFSSYLGFSTRDSPVEELQALCSLLEEKTAETAESLLAAGDLWPDQKEKKEFPRLAQAAMNGLGERYPQLKGPYPKPKALILSEILSIQSLSGIYSPFTIEANYNGDMTAWNIPHTACHELSHLRGFMGEDEANFIGFLACIGSESEYFRYSGYLTAYVYVHNALFRRDAESAMEIYALLPECVLSDLAENSAFWKQYEGRISEASARVNDTYLKANNQAEGVESYGRMVDLLLAYYREEKGLPFR